MDARIVDGRKIARVTDDGKLEVLVHGRDGDNLVPVKVSEDGYLMLATDVTVDLGTVELNQGAPGQNPWPVTLSGSNVADGTSGPAISFVLDDDGVPVLRVVDAAPFAYDAVTGRYKVEIQANADALTTPVHTTVNVGATSTTVLPANAARKYVLIVNYSDVEVDLRLGEDAVVGEGIPLLTRGSAYEMSAAAGNLYKGAINAIHASAGTKKLLVLEAI